MTVPSSLCRRTWKSGAYIEAQNLCKRLPASDAISYFIQPEHAFDPPILAARLQLENTAFPLRSIMAFEWEAGAGAALLKPIVNCRTLRSITIADACDTAEMKALLAALKASETVDEIAVYDPSLFSDALELVATRRNWTGCDLSVSRNATDSQWATLIECLRAQRVSLLLRLQSRHFPDSFWAELKHMASVTALGLKGSELSRLKADVEFHPNLCSLVTNRDFSGAECG
jgi:hypothetical protein